MIFRPRDSRIGAPLSLEASIASCPRELSLWSTTTPILGPPRSGVCPRMLKTSSSASFQNPKGQLLNTVGIVSSSLSVSLENTLLQCEGLPSNQPLHPTLRAYALSAGERRR